MARRRLVLVLATALPIALLLTAITANVAAGGGGCHARLERDAAEMTVRLVGNCMDPLVARVPTGATVTFINADDRIHVITGGAGAWGSFDELAGGDQVAYRFTRPGVYPYACHLHPGMTGAIVVGDGGPGGTGQSVIQVKSGVPATPVPAATASADARLTATSTASSGGPWTEPEALLTIGLVAALLAAGGAYGFGLLPAFARPRTRSR